MPGSTVTARQVPSSAIAGDDEEAIQVASRLVRDIGYEPVLIGGLEMARHLMSGSSLSGERTPEEIRRIAATFER